LSITDSDTLSLGKRAGKRLCFEAVDSMMSSDAGLLILGQFDEQLGLTKSFAGALRDPRVARSGGHSYLEMTRSRVFGIVADYPDQNDHDALRADPVFKILAGRAPDGEDLASQPTLSRFENNIAVDSLNRLRDVFIDQFIASFPEPPKTITLDVDPFDDPTHGCQQMTFFHAYYGQYQYLPRLITCAENDLIVMACLLHGTAWAGLGVEDDLLYLVGRLREAFPGVVIRFRADSGFATPSVYRTCEELDLIYTIGLKMNPRLVKMSEETLQAAQNRFDETGEPQRTFCVFEYQAKSWAVPRSVVVKVEVTICGTNRRAVVTNRPGAFLLPGATYDEYAERGESENRNKEMKEGFQADRLSDSRYMANLFRLYLHSLAANFLTLLRREVANPPRRFRTDQDCPREALAEPDRRRYFNRRRQEDPLGEGHACTWRTRLIKVAAEIVVSARRILVRLPSSWPYLSHFWAVAETLKTRFPALEFR